MKPKSKKPKPFKLNYDVAEKVAETMRPTKDEEKNRLLRQAAQQIRDMRIQRRVDGAALGMFDRVHELLTRMNGNSRTTGMSGECCTDIGYEIDRILS
jgi:hypothetical protein